MKIKPVLAFVAIMLGSTSWCEDAKEKKLLDGTWLPTAAEQAGEKLPEPVVKSIKLIIAGDSYTVFVGEAMDRGTVKLGVKGKQKTLEITGTEGPNKGKTMLAIYNLKGDTLEVCYDLSGKATPADFKTTKGSKLFLVTYQRAKP